jgi:prevent-host-death family protein
MRGHTVKPNFWEYAKSIATRDFSKNPSRALRDAEDQPVVITKYGQPVACLVSMEHWHGLRRQAQERAFDDRVLSDSALSARALEDRAPDDEIRPITSIRAVDYYSGK